MKTKYHSVLTPESAYYACFGPREQQIEKLRHIIADINNFPGEWEMDKSEEKNLLNEAKKFLSELE